MKKNHAGFWAGLGTLFLAAVYSMVLFFVKPVLNATSWVLFGFTIVAFVLAGIQTIAIARSGSAIVMDSTLLLITSIYFSLQFVFGGIVCMCFTDLPLVPILIGEIILLACYFVITFVLYGAQSHMSAQDGNDTTAVRKMRMLEIELLGMADQQTDPQIKQALKRLSESIHFCDVVSLPVLADVEGRIAQNVAALQGELDDSSANPLARIETIHQLLKERDRTAAIIKR